MPLYKFKVSDQKGKVSELLLEGDSQEEASRRIQYRGLMPLEYIGEGSQSIKKNGFLKPKLSVVDFTDRLVPLLEANIPLERALTLLGDDKENPAMSELIAQLRRGLQEGRKFSDLIRERRTIFPPLYSGVVEAGEEAGALSQVMGELRRFLMQSQDLKSFIISSSVYPIFIMAVGIVMLFLVLGVIVPRFASAMAGAGMKSTAIDILIGVSNLFSSYWWVFVLIAGGVGYVVAQLRKENNILRKKWDRIVLSLPVFRKLVVYSNLSRLCRTMAILMRNGVHLLNTVTIANRVVQNIEIRESLQNVCAELRQGQRISSALSKSKYIPSMMLRMIDVGEETGGVEVMLERIADRYESDLKRIVKRLLSLFEPMIIIFLGLGVGSIVLLMFMAIMDMQGAI